MSTATVSYTGGSTVSSYSYNGDGQRVRRNIGGSETWQIYGMDGELLAEYESGAATFLPVKEYGYCDGALLVTMSSGDVQRLKRFVKSLYYNALGRDASATELQQQMDTLGPAGTQGEAQLLTAAKQMARSLFESSEYLARGRTDSQYVTDLYNAYLQRGPDTAGLNFWVNNTQLYGRGATLNAFEVSTEFATLASTVYGTATSDNQRVEHFVSLFYNGALQRDPTSTELQQQTQRLNNAAALGQSQVIAEARTMGGEIFQATNYNSNHTVQEYVTDLYEAFLQRAPDGPGLNFWVNNTNSNGRAATLAAFQASTEYGELAGTLYRETFWLVSDQMGTPRMIVDRTGTLAGIKRHDYLPFGEELMAPVGGRSTTGGYSGISNVRQQFTQKERDNETGLDYSINRYYSPTQGRLTSVDPLLESGEPPQPQSWNRYSYSINNPLRFMDPDGLRYVQRTLADGTIQYGWCATDECYNNAIDTKGKNYAGWTAVTFDESKPFEYTCECGGGGDRYGQYRLNPDGTNGYADVLDGNYHAMSTDLVCPAADWRDAQGFNGCSRRALRRHSWGSREIDNSGGNDSSGKECHRNSCERRHPDNRLYEAWNKQSNR